MKHVEKMLMTTYSRCGFPWSQYCRKITTWMCCVQNNTHFEQIHSTRDLVWSKQIGNKPKEQQQPFSTHQYIMLAMCKKTTQPHYFSQWDHWFQSERPTHQLRSRTINLSLLKMTQIHGWTSVKGYVALISSVAIRALSLQSEESVAAT